MIKITHYFYQTKSKKTSWGLLSLFALLFMSTQISWGQQSIGTGQYDGGFENASLYTTGALTQTSPNATMWSYDSGNLSTSNISTTDKRSGSKSFYCNSTTGTGKYIMSPVLNPALVGGDGGSVKGPNYVIQYYIKSSTASATKPAVYVSTRSSNAGTQSTADSNGWQKVTWRSSGVTAVATPPTWTGFASNVAGFTAYVDDFVVYLPSAYDIANTSSYDTTIPDAPTIPVVSGLDVSWTAPVTGVDNGGYMVVRYATNPNADNDPNINGIYAVGNTITNGTGSLVGTVVYTGTETSFTDAVAGSVSGSDYYKIYTVDKAFNYSDEITGTAGAGATTTTWTTSWSNGTPDSTIEAIIDGTYSGAAFDAKKLTINASKSLAVTSGNMTIQNEVINDGTMIVENNANLIQVNPAAVNTGNITVKRNSNDLLRLDYTLWSSPVLGLQTLANFSPLTSQSPNRFYTYDTANNQYSNTFDPTATNFAAGTGYLIRMPNTADSGIPTAYAGEFTGVPNNGDIPVTMVDGGAGNRFNLVGNPYPSPITISTFVTDNTNITGTLYFWRKTNGLGTAYCTYTGGVFTTNGNSQSADPAGVIQTGQGFFVEANGSGTALTFKNGQRVANNSGQFFKTKQVAKADKIWLNATNTAGDFSQMAINYTEGATQGIDAFDGKYINDSPLALTSNINNEEYTIQGRPAFDASDSVPLSFKTDVAGDYTIAIDHTDGVFATGQDVYLVDNTTGTETNLKTDSYTFTASAGTASTRFSLKYQKTLKVDAPAFNENSVTVYRNNGTVYVNSGANAINNIKVYDVLGRLLAEQKSINASTASIKTFKTNQILIVKVSSQDNTTVSKKVVN
jgi:hypothetical protein